MSVACPGDPRYLYQSSNPGVIEYLCNRLFDLSESALDAYLLQLVYLAVGKPGGALERTLVELASRSFKLALKVPTAAAVMPCACGMHMHHGGWGTHCMAHMHGMRGVLRANRCMAPTSMVRARCPGKALLQGTHMVHVTMSHTACQVYWLLLALVQDNPKNKHLDNLKETVELAAMDGKWVSARAGRVV